MSCSSLNKAKRLAKQGVFQSKSHQLLCFETAKERAPEERKETDRRLAKYFITLALLLGSEYFILRSKIRRGNTIVLSRRDLFTTITYVNIKRCELCNDGRLCFKFYIRSKVSQMALQSVIFFSRQSNICLSAHIKGHC